MAARVGTPEFEKAQREREKRKQELANSVIFVAARVAADDLDRGYERGVDTVDWCARDSHD